MKLHEASKTNKVKWKETVDEGTYQVSFPKYSIQISSVPTQHPAAEGNDIVLTVINQEGRIVEQMRDWDEDVTTYVEKSYEKMSELYDYARRQAMGLDEAFDYLLDQLEDLPF